MLSMLIVQSYSIFFSYLVIFYKTMSSLDSGTSSFISASLVPAWCWAYSTLHQSFLNEGIWLGSPVSGLKGQNDKVLKWFKGSRDGWVMG